MANEENPESSLKQLPAGKYRARIEIRFVQPLPEEAPVGIWPARTITSNPVEFEITPNDAAAKANEPNANPLLEKARQGAIDLAQQMKYPADKIDGAARAESLPDRPQAAAETPRSQKGPPPQLDLTEPAAKDGLGAQALRFVPAGQEEIRINAILYEVTVRVDFTRPEGYPIRELHVPSLNLAVNGGLSDLGVGPQVFRPDKDRYAGKDVTKLKEVSLSVKEAAKLEEVFQGLESVQGMIRQYDPPKKR